MKRILSILLLCSVALFGAPIQHMQIAAIKKQAAGGGGLAFSDDFNRSNDTDLNAAGIGGYTELTPGGWSIFSNQLANSTGAFTFVSAVNDGNPTSTVNQYIKLTAVDSGDACIPLAIFRFTDASSPFYTVIFNDSANEIAWERVASVGGARTVVDSVSHTPTFPLTVGITVVGTGNSTVVSVWLSPSGADPAGWGAADFTFTDDPGSPVDTGNICGLGAFAQSVSLFDEWFWGDAP